jgi:hypothetical protein
MEKIMQLLFRAALLIYPHKLSLACTYQTRILLQIEFNFANKTKLPLQTIDRQQLKRRIIF